MFECLLLSWQKSTILHFNSIFGTTPEISGKLYFVEISLGEVMSWRSYVLEKLSFGEVMAF